LHHEALPKQGLWFHSQIGVVVFEI